jgi:hypothetical protein
MPKLLAFLFSRGDCAVMPFPGGDCSYCILAHHHGESSLSEPGHTPMGGMWHGGVEDLPWGGAGRFWLG